MTSHPKLPRTTRNEAVTCGQSKTYQNDCVDTNRLMRVQWQRKRIRDRSLFITWGGGGAGGFGAKTRWNLADPLFEFYFTEVIPPNNVWRLSPSPPPMSSFSKQIWVVPPECFQSFQRPPLFGSQQEPIKLVLSSQLIPPFVLLPIRWSPLKYPAPPPPQAINNDRSLMLTGP